MKETGKIVWGIGVFFFSIFMICSIMDVTGSFTADTMDKNVPIAVKIVLIESMVICIGLMLIGKKLMDDEKVMEKTNRPNPNEKRGLGESAVIEK